VIPNPIVFYNQYLQQVSFSVIGSGTGYSAPTLNFLSGGSAQVFTLAQSATPLFLDTGSSWSVTPNPLASSIQGNSWTAASGTSGSVTRPGTIDPVYVEISGQIPINLQVSFGVSDTLASPTQAPLSDGVIVSDTHLPQPTASLSERINLKDTYIAPITAPLIDSVTLKDTILSPVKTALTDFVSAVEKLTRSSTTVVSGVPYQGELIYIVHSPVNILVTDARGMHAGFNSTGQIVDTIPGALIFPKNSTQLEAIVIPNPLSGKYSVEVFPVNGGGNYTVELQLTNINGTVVKDIHQTGSVTSGTQYLGVTLSSGGQVTEAPPSTASPFQPKLGYTTLILIVSIAAVAIAVAGSTIFLMRRHRR
jgi:hypothetical protein